MDESDETDARTFTRSPTVPDRTRGDSQGRAADDVDGQLVSGRLETPLFRRRRRAVRAFRRARVTVVVSALFVVCCSAALWYVLRERRPHRGVATCEVFRLSPSELQALEWRAELGDAEAAYRVSQHYEGWVLDLRLGRVWLERAARRGHRDATYSLAVLLIESKSAPDRTRGRRLLTELVALGVPHARETLEYLDKPQE